MPIPRVSYEDRRIHPERMRAVLEHAGRSVLDVGCGNGAYVLELSGRYEICGVDERPFESWKKNPDLFSLSRCDELAFEENRFDTVLSFETLEHLEDPARALGEYHRVCRKNLILTVPNCDVTDGMRESHLTYYHWVDGTHRHFFSMPAITELVEKTGFRIAKRCFINEISPAPLWAEAFGLPPWLGSLGRKFRIARRKRYFLTLLLIAEK